MVAPGDAFQQYFWGDKNAGFDVLLSNMKQGCTATKELHEILRERANYEEAFSKSLRRLSERASTINTVGSFLPVWVVIKKYIENMSQIHSTFSARFKELCQELNTFLDAGSKANKANRENMDVVKTSCSLANIKRASEHVNKCKKTYHQKHKELVEGEENLTKAGNMTERSEKEHEKIQQKFTKCQEAFQASETSYKDSIDAYNKVQEEYNENMTACCKFFGEVEQTHLSSIVEFAKRFGDIETELCDDLKKNCESVLGEGDSDEQIKGLIGFSPEILIEMFVEEKKTGFEMAPHMTAELLTTKDAPVLSVTPKPIDKNSDSGSVHSLPTAQNHTNSTNINSMTMAVSNMSMKAFKKMLKKKQKNSKAKEGVAEGDSKSLDSKNSRDEDNSDNVSVGNTSERSQGEQDFFERHAAVYFSSDSDDDEYDESEDDGLTAKVKTIKIKTPGTATEAEATEEQLRKATESLTLNCLSPNTYHRNRATTHNPQLFSAYSHSLADLPMSPETQPKLFPTTFDTPRAKSVSGNISSPRISPRRFPGTPENSQNNDNAWAVFDDSFKGPKNHNVNDGHVMDVSVASWSTPPPSKRSLFDEHKIESKENSNEKSNNLDELLDLSPPIITTSSSNAKQDIEDLLSITVDESRNISPSSEYMTPESSPTNPEDRDKEQQLDEEQEEEEEEDGPAAGGVRKSRLNSLIEFSPVRLGSDINDPLSSTQKSEEDIAVKTKELELTPDMTEERSLKNNISHNSEEMVVEDSKLLSVVGKAQSLDTDLHNMSDKANGDLQTPALNLGTFARSTPVLPSAFSPEPSPTRMAGPSILQPTLTGDLLKSVPTVEKPTTLSTENVVFSSENAKTVEEDRAEMVYPIAIAVIETAHAMFKADVGCTSKIEGELIMSLPLEAASDLSLAHLPPGLKIKLNSTIPPSSFIVNRQIFSIKPPSITDLFELNMNLLQDFLKKRLATIGHVPRVNIPLLKYNLPVMAEELAPLIARSVWSVSEEEITLLLDLSVNQTLANHNFYFPKITLANSLSGQPNTIRHAKPVVQLTNGVLKWERLDIGREILDNPDRLQASFDPTQDCTPTPTHIEFELEGVVLSGTDVCLEDSESYSVHTTVKKIKSGKYWSEPKVLESTC